MSQLTHYIELKAIPQIEIPHSAIMAIALQNLHRILPLAEGQIGLGFPQYHREQGLGHLIRLFGTEENLKSLQPKLFGLDELSNYFLIEPMTEVPKTTKPVRYQRVQHKGASAIRRSEKRLKERGLWSEEIAQRMAVQQQQIKRYPHVFLRSYTTGQKKFLLEIQQVVCNQHQAGEFNGYGLSKTATVPHF